MNGGPIDLDDLGLKKNFSFFPSARATSVYNDYMVQVRLYAFVQRKHTACSRLAVLRREVS